MWPGFEAPHWHLMWVEFDLSRALIGFFAGTDVLRLGFRSPKKPTSAMGLVKPRRNGK